MSKGDPVLLKLAVAGSAPVETAAKADAAYQAMLPAQLNLEVRVQLLPGSQTVFAPALQVFQPASPVVCFARVVSAHYSLVSVVR